MLSNSRLLTSCTRLATSQVKQCCRSISYKRLQTHKLQVGPPESDRAVSYQSVMGVKRPTVVMVPGLHPYTHQQGQKALCLQRFCDMNSYPCVVYDHECCGLSGGVLDNLLFTHWVEDCLAVVDQLTQGPVILVGSSLGGWLSLVVGQQIKSRLHSMVLVSPAVNYVWPYYNRYKSTLPPHVARRLDQGDPHVITHELGDSMLKLDFALDSRQFELDLESDKLVDIDCPVRIIHGLHDRELSVDTSMKLCNILKSEDVDLIVRKIGDHQMEQPTDLELLLVTLDRIIKDNPVH